MRNPVRRALVAAVVAIPTVGVGLAAHNAATAQQPWCVASNAMPGWAGQVVVGLYDAPLACNVYPPQRLDLYLPYGTSVNDGVGIADQLGGHIRLVVIDADY